MDWNWRNFSGETTFRENKQLHPTFSDSIGSSGLESHKDGEPILKGSSQDSSTDNRFSSTSQSQGSSKRTRMLNGTQNQTCLVDGCDADLTNCKDYHRRHRVCDTHSKTPVVLVGGHQKRFCQQCSRFHLLSEFDEVKRSCRKRLDGHNRRRRKPQPESLIFSPRDFLSNCKGPIVLQFSDPQIHVADLGRSLWPTRTEEKAMVPPNSSACFSYGGDHKRMPFFLQKNGTKQGRPMASQFSFSQPLPDTVSLVSEVGSHKMVPTDISSEDSGCALYLLSSHPVQALPDSGLSSLVESHPTLPLQTPDSELHFNSLSDFSGSFGSKDKPVCKTGIHGDLVLEMEEADSLFQSEVPHKFPISWE